MKILNQFLKHIMPGVIKPVHALWNEVIGFVFLVLAAFVGLSTYRRAEHITEEGGGVLIVIASCLFALMLAWFGISSFLKARRISRS